MIRRLVLAAALAVAATAAPASACVGLDCLPSPALCLHLGGDPWHQWCPFS